MLRKQQEMPRMSKPARGRVKLRRGRAINNEVACAKLWHSAVGELLP